MSKVLTAKCLSMLIIFLGSVICGLLPAFRVFSSFPRFALSLILSYGGGILIATSLVHILPEARESWPEETRFTAEMSLCVGIFIVYCVEEVAHFLVCHDLHSPLGHAGDSDGHNHGVHVHHDEPPNRCDEPAAVYLFADDVGRSGDFARDVRVGDVRSKEFTCNDVHTNAVGDFVDSKQVVEEDSSRLDSPVVPNLNNRKIVVAKQKHHHNHDHHHHHCGEGEQHVKLVIPPSSEPKPNNSNPSTFEDKDEKKKTVIAKLRSLVGLIALSVHAGLEGLSVGLGREASDVWYLCLAIAAHKLVIAFCLGMEVRNASASTCTIVTTSSSAAFKFRYVLFFALMTPLGIAIGTIITEATQNPEDPSTESTLVAVLQTLAAGTLLYVAFFEVILRERARFSGKGLAQLAFVIMGFTTMCLVEVYIGGHDHSHGGHGHHDHSHENENGFNVTTVPPTLNSNLIDP